MTVNWQGPDTSDKKVLLSGYHDGEVEETQDKQWKQVGFKAEYFFFDKGCNKNGFKTKGLKPSLVKATKVIDFKNDHAFKKEFKAFPMNRFAGKWSGKIQIKKGGKYTFYTKSDDGSRLYINKKRIVNNWGIHGNRERKGTLNLKPGWHDFKAKHFENAGGASMVVSWKGPDTGNKKALLKGHHDGKIKEIKP